jgi:hypothetical protein
METPDSSTGRPDFDNPKASVAARPFDAFDLDSVPVVGIGVQNFW